MLMVQCKPSPKRKLGFQLTVWATVLRAALPVLRGGQLCDDDREMLVHPNAALS
jgi:hypothetical protein